MTGANPPSARTIHERDVLEYLRTHPTFMQAHPEILEWLQVPEPQHGEGILDFQHYALKALKQRVADAQQQIGTVVQGAHSRHSLQAQSQQAVLALMKARNLEQFLECICIDFVRLFQVDVIRLALESELGGLFESYYPEQHYSGLTFLALGSCAELFAPRQEVRMVADTAFDHPWLSEVIFHECAQLATSVVLLSLPLPMAGRAALLALGVRGGWPLSGWSGNGIFPVCRFSLRFAP